MKRCEDSIWVKSTRVLAGLACCRLFVLTSGLHGPRVRLIMPKHFEELNTHKKHKNPFTLGLISPVQPETYQKSILYMCQLLIDIIQGDFNRFQTTQTNTSTHRKWAMEKEREKVPDAEAYKR